MSDWSSDVCSSDLARVRWGEVKAQGFEATYWQADENGRWQKKA